MINDTIKKVYAQVDKTYEPKDSAIIRLERQGEVYAVGLNTLNGIGSGILKLNKDEYVVKSTGEIKQFDHAETKQAANLKQSFEHLRGLIRTNFTQEAENQLFVTLTYAENMTDPEKLYDDFKVFFQRLRRAYSAHTLEYIAVAEPQGRGAWHFHIMIKSDQEQLFIADSKMRSLWGDEGIARKILKKHRGLTKEVIKNMPFAAVMAAIRDNNIPLPDGYKPVPGHGFTSTERLKSDDVGNYYVAYFTNVIGSKGSEKQIKKGARLHFYPPYFKFYRCSRGIIQPEKDILTRAEVEREYGKPKYSKALEIIEEQEDGSARTLNKIYRATYKKDTS